MPMGFMGMGNMSKKQKLEMQTNLERFKIIMDSMTTHEKNEPLVLKQERIKRIALGSGTTERDVRDLLAQWKRSRKMMKGVRGNRRLRKQMKDMMGDMDDVDMPM
jgi:signal recognition particle subunit SRP54